MKNKFLVLFALLSLAVCGTGCYSTADGHMKAGIPFSKDKIVSRYERSVQQISTAARTVLTHNGQITADDTANNAFQAKINQRNVWVKVSKVDEKVSEVVVQARTRAGKGDVDLASEISKQIAIQLAVAQ